MSQRERAFTEVLPKLPAKRAAVWQAIRSQAAGGATLAELVAITGWPINRLSGRVSELAERGYLREDGVRGRQTVWVACLPHEPMAPKARVKTVSARVDAIEEPDLFGRRRIIVTIPGDLSVAHIEPESLVGLKF